MQFTQKKGFTKATPTNPPPPPPSVRSMPQPKSIATTRAVPTSNGPTMNFKNVNPDKPSCRSCGH